MKLSSLTIACMLQALAFEVSLFSTTFTMTSAMKMTNMLMGQPLETFLSDLVSFDEMTKQQKQSILRMADGDVSLMVIASMPSPRTNRRKACAPTSMRR
mmetsp:Transcript_3183/g.7079  ORF Transcript_3183/g.7079 Transcript_3183/m.7079 type:complete len:99 (+) Transcript_3183:47-343(+)